MIGEARSLQGCPECDEHLGLEAGKTVCTDCDLIVSEYRINRSPEWHSFAGDDRSPARTGTLLTRSRYNHGLSTKTSRLTRVRGHGHRQFAHVRRQHDRTRISTKREYSQVYAFAEIRRVTSALSLPNHTHDQACSLLESAQDEDLLHGHSLEGFVAAYVYIACRVADVSRSIEEVYDMSKATEVEYQTAYGALNRGLDLPIAPVNPAEHLPRFVTKLDPDSDTKRRACECVAETRDEGLVDGKNPCGTTAACLHTAASDHSEGCTQTEAADIVGVTPVTFRKMYVTLHG